MQRSREQIESKEAESTRAPVAIDRKQRILVAEDDYEMCRLIAAALRRAGYSVTMCANGINLLDQLGSYLLDRGEDTYSLIITDIRMPGVTGMEILAGMSRVEGAPPIILITAFGDDETHLEAARLGAVRVLDKPFEMGTLLDLVQKTLRE
jgi:DNA-binding response OmpR family regulator